MSDHPSSPDDPQPHDPDRPALPPATPGAPGPASPRVSAPGLTEGCSGRVARRRPGRSTTRQRGLSGLVRTAGLSGSRRAEDRRRAGRLRAGWLRAAAGDAAGERLGAAGAYQQGPVAPPKQVTIASVISFALGGLCILLGLFALTSAGEDIAETLTGDAGRAGLVVAVILICGAAYILPGDLPSQAAAVGAHHADRRRGARDHGRRQRAAGQPARARAALAR